MPCLGHGVYHAEMIPVQKLQADSIDILNRMLRFNPKEILGGYWIRPGSAVFHHALTGDTRGRSEEFLFFNNYSFVVLHFFFFGLESNKFQH